MRRYLAPYQEMVQRIGADRFEALLWSSRETQIARFRAAAEMFDLSGRIVVDAGCGHGDFAAYLVQRGIGYAAYVGLEALPDVLAVAQSRGFPRAGFLNVDFVADRRAFDRAVAQGAAAAPGAGTVIVFSGSLNTLDQDAALPVLERAWRACTDGLVFNFLCRLPGLRGAVSWEASPVRKFDAVEIVRWAIEHTPLVAYRQDYLEGTDGTVAMRVR